jgi:hypothetical protein
MQLEACNTNLWLFIFWIAMHKPYQFLLKFNIPADATLQNSSHLLLICSLFSDTVNYGNSNFCFEWLEGSEYWLGMCTPIAVLIIKTLILEGKHIYSL